jgi:hypothetical protein
VDFCAAGWPSGYIKTLDTCLECEAEIVQTDQEKIEDPLIQTAVDTSRAGVVYNLASARSLRGSKMRGKIVWVTKSPDMSSTALGHGAVFTVL